MMVNECGYGCRWDVSTEAAGVDWAGMAAGGLAATGQRVWMQLHYIHRSWTSGQGPCQYRKGLSQGLFFF